MGYGYEMASCRRACYFGAGLLLPGWIPFHPFFYYALVNCTFLPATASRKKPDHFSFIYERTASCPVKVVRLN